MFKTQKFPDRRKELNDVLNTINLNKLWMDWVRPDLRSQPLFDLHDYYDFQLYRKDKISKLIETIFDGSYQPSRPNRIRKEKSNGIARHLVVLQPEDALILEALGQYLYPYVEKNGKSKNAFFSQKHKKNSSIEEISNQNNPYNHQAWWELWPVFQNKICGFTKLNKYVIVTDIATYYDSISMQSLRNSISSSGHFSEGFLDFLFFMIDHFSWRPDYIPYTGKGLAQMSLEAPRVLAHAYLFDIDNYLERATGSNFTRWMDDIDFGIDDLNTAKKILQGLDEILLSKGLHLNSSKTKLLDSKQANEHFHFTENAFLNILGNNIDLSFKSKKLYQEKLNTLKRRYFLFKKKEKGNKDKILKRYLTLFAKFKCNSIDKDLSELLFGTAALRSNIFRFLSLTGWSESKQKIVEDFIYSSLDDEGMLEATRLLILWHVPNSIRYRNSMRKLANHLHLTATKDEQCRLVCSLWLHCKFSTPKELAEFIRATVPIWRAKPWMARQFAATWPLLNQKTRTQLKNVIYINGLTSARSVVDNLERIEHPDTFITNNIMPYISAFSTNKTYPLHKAIIARAFYMGSPSSKAKQTFEIDTLQKIRDIQIKILIRKPIR